MKDHETGIEEVVGSRGCVGDDGRMCESGWVAEWRIRAILRNPDGGGLYMLADETQAQRRTNAHSPILGVVGQLPRIACAGMDGRYPVIW